MLKVVGIGGGTGLPVLLKGLKQICASPDFAPTDIAISAIVCVSDNGGSSGTLRRNFGIPAVGDLRNCLVALSDSDLILADLFQYRFSGGNGFTGHSLGNLIVTALHQMSGKLGRAISLAQEVLCSAGAVYPVTEELVTLCAELETGEQIRGECQITAARGRIKRIWLEPENAAPFDGALRAIKSADVIVLGPGSLYTSLLPNLLVVGVADAIRNSPALKLFVCNLVTQHGETDGFSAADHLRALEMHLGFRGIDICAVNSSPITSTQLLKYLESGSGPVSWQEDEILQMGVIPVVTDLLKEGELKIRHDPVKLARLIVSQVSGAGAAARVVSAQRSLVT
jgi:uncharacterized cofD-like protein